MAENKLSPQTREDRDLASRVAAERPKQWSPPTLLPDPKPQDGWAYRWIRLAVYGQNDPTNISAKFREGWEPVRASDHPEVMVYSDTEGRFKDNIVVGGLMLCKTPIEFVQQRDAYIQKQTDGQMKSVDNSFMRENNPKMPLFNERRSEVSFGKGT
jgi:hypothetical protein